MGDHDIEDEFYSDNKENIDFQIQNGNINLLSQVALHYDTFDILGKRQRKPTAKVADNPELIQQLRIKTEEPEPSLSDPLPSIEEALENIVGSVEPPPPKKSKKDETPKKEKNESPKKAAKAEKTETAADDVATDDKTKEKENQKPAEPGVKVKKQRANIPCPRCGKMHRNEDHLEKHIMVVHEGIKPYLCDICGYGTNLRVKMELHMATKHNEDKVLSYVCDVCDYKCSNQLHLRAHLQIVHLENLTPFECGVCQYQCRKRASVVKHMKIVHEKRRPFQCTQCDKSFPVNSVLLRHIESVHDKVRIFTKDTKEK